MAPRRLPVRLRYAPFVPGPGRNRATAGTQLLIASSGCVPRTIVAPRRLPIRLRYAPLVSGPDRIRATDNVNALRARSGCAPRTIAAPYRLPVALVRDFGTRNGPKSGGFASWSFMSSVLVYYPIMRIILPQDPIARVITRSANTPGSLWGYFKSQFLAGRHFWAVIPCQNGVTAPRTGSRYPHFGNANKALRKARGGRDFQKTPTPPGPPEDPWHRAAVGS